MVDYYPGIPSQSVDAAAQHYTPITPSDTVDLPFRTRGVWIGASGVVAAVGNNGVAVPFNGAVAGSVLPIRCRRINATGTSAGSLIALY
jgi:hypothetical protein